MSAERHTGSEVLQALVEAREALRTERRTRHPLSGENARLRARLSRLQAERDRLLRTLAALKEAPPPAAVQLPEPLTPPFRVRPRRDLVREYRAFLPAPLLVLAMVAMEWSTSPRARTWNLALLALVLLVQACWFWFLGRGWRFTPSGFSGRAGERAWLFVRYAEVVGVAVSVTPHQRRHGVGTVVLSVRPGSASVTRSLHLQDVPEPERLAAWLRARCPRTA